MTWSKKMNQIRITGPRDQWGFLSPLYPSPFTLDGERWRSLEHWIQASMTSNQDEKDRIRKAISPYKARILTGNVSERDLWRGLVAKFEANPELLSQLRATGRTSIVIVDPGTPRSLGPLLERLRDQITIPPEDTRDRDVIMGNLYALLKAQGYTEISRSRSVWNPVPLENAPTDWTSVDMLVRGSSEGKNIEAVIDIFLDEKFNRTRAIQVIRDIKWSDPEVKRAYIVVAQLEHKNLNEILRIIAFRDVKIFSPAQLHIRPSQHILTPPVRRIPMLPEGLDPTKIPSISVNDVLIKELGLRVGDIIEVHDFSPHYRFIV